MAIDANEIVRRLEELGEEELAYQARLVIERLSSYNQLYAQQQELLSRAQRAYKARFRVPRGFYADLGTLLDWLMESNGHREALYYRQALEAVLVELEQFGDLDFSETYNVSGSTLIRLRALAQAALVARAEEMRLTNEAIARTPAASAAR